jgi:hypothetical protein
MESGLCALRFVRLLEAEVDFAESSDRSERGFIVSEASLKDAL